MHRGRSRGCYRLGFKFLGSRRAIKETEKGGRGSFCKLEKLEREVTVSISHPKVPSSNPERGDLFLQVRRFFIFNQLFAFGFEIKG